MAARLPGYLLRNHGRLLQVYDSRRLHTTTQLITNNNYQSDFDSFQLTPTTTSHQIYWQTAEGLRDKSNPPQVFNELVQRKEMMKLTGGSVTLEKDDDTGIATITLSNPSKANALSGQMMVELADIVQELETWERGKAVILTGDEAGNHFCAGLDLETANSLDAQHAGARMCIFMQNTLSRLQRLRMLSVAAIGGTVVGAGAEITVACDFRLLAVEGQIWFIQSMMGVTPGLGGGSRLVKALGPRQALKILSSGMAVKADDAFKLGLVDHLIPSNVGLVKYTKSWLETYTHAAAEVIWGIKTVINAGSELPLDQALSREKDVFASLWGGPHQKEAFAKAAKSMKSVGKI